jgi:nucleoside-diphosphate-sugar epimerase
MKILILGGTRYFGKRLTKNLLAAGYEVTVLTRGNTDPGIQGIHRLTGDRTSFESMQKALGDQRFDVVVDNICMTAKDAEISLQLFTGKISHYIMTSTLSIYPFLANQKETDYDPRKYKPTPPTHPGEEYAEGKRAAEQVFYTKAPFKTAILRIPVVVGEDDYTQRLLKQVQMVQEGKAIYFPNIQAKFSFIRSEDAALGIQWLIENHKEGIYNFATAEAIPLAEMIEMIEKAVGKKAVLAKNEKEGSWSPFGVPSDWYMNVEKAKREGFSPPSLYSWLPDLIQKLSH